MRKIILIGLMISFTTLKAQVFVPGIFNDNVYSKSFASNINLNDSSFKRKWSLSRYNGISASFAFFKGGSATIISAPVGLQLNRRLSNNLYAFAGVSLAPSYINFQQRFLTDFNKANQNNSFLNSGFGVYSRAELGLQYINPDKTFSISGSIGVERSTYPAFQYNSINNKKIFQ